jgi:hypothetical protein
MSSHRILNHEFKNSQIGRMIAGKFRKRSHVLIDSYDGHEIVKYALDKVECCVTCNLFDVLQCRHDDRTVRIDLTKQCRQPRPAIGIRFPSDPATPIIDLGIEFITDDIVAKTLHVVARHVSEEALHGYQGIGTFYDLTSFVSMSLWVYVPIQWELRAHGGLICLSRGRGYGDN